jgi:hypothetical protein
MLTLRKFGTQFLPVHKCELLKKIRSKQPLVVDLINTKATVLRYEGIRALVHIEL